MIKGISRANSSVTPLLRLLPTEPFENYRPRGIWLFRMPITDTAAGFLFDTSMHFGPQKWVTRFVFPLWIETEHLFLSFSDRLPIADPRPLSVNSASSEELKETIQIMIEDGLDWIETRSSPEGVYSLIPKIILTGAMARLEYAVFTAARLNLFDEALAHSKEARNFWRQMPLVDRSDHYDAMLARIESFAKMIIDAPDSVTPYLDDLVVKNKVKFKLNDLR